MKIINDSVTVEFDEKDLKNALLMYYLDHQFDKDIPIVNKITKIGPITKGKNWSIQFEGKA